MNTLKTWILMGALASILVLAGNAIGGSAGATTAFIMALVMNVAGYWFSDKMVLRMSGARPMDEGEYPELHAMTARISERAGIPKPKLYIVPQEQPNAFATGRNPANAAVAFTQGILRYMPKEEIEGVLAHEISHIRNYDTLVGTLAATLAGAITWIANMARWTAFLGGGSDEEGDNPMNMVGAVLMMVLAPIAALLVQMAISRSREYLADTTAAELTGKPEGLARALERLALGTDRIPMDASMATAHMYIANPLGLGGLAALFSTHPPMAERIKRLRAIR